VGLGRGVRAKRCLLSNDERQYRRGFVRQSSLNDYALVAWRRKWLILAVALIAAVSAYFYSRSQAPVYEASAYVMYIPESTAALAGSGQVYSQYTSAVELQSVGIMIASPIIGDRVSSAMGWGDHPPRFTVQTQLVGGLGGSGDTGSTSVAAITVQATNPSLAAGIANAYAKQFVDWRLSNERDQIAKAQQVVSDELQHYQTDASRLSPEYAQLKDRLQSLNVLYGTATGGFQIVMPATAPTGPVSPLPKRTALAGLALGAIAGLGLAFILQQLDRKLRDYKEAGELLGLRIIGRIPRMPADKLKPGPLFVLTDPAGDGAESIRMLRTNLEFLSLDPGVSVLAIVSPGKGDGKTITAANLAVAMALSGKRVIAVDADLRQPDLHTAFGLSNHVGGVGDVIRGRLTVSAALRQVTLPLWANNAGTLVRPLPGPKTSNDVSGPDLQVLTAGSVPPNPGEVVGSRRFGALLRELRQMDVDCVLVDTPGILSDATAIMSQVDGVVFVVYVDAARQSKLEELRDATESLPCVKLGVVVTGKGFRSSETAKYYAS
jgi:Mrp family chromosome partitioning ATPase/capsular polysaccharide biosynthesis protein